MKNIRVMIMLGLSAGWAAAQLRSPELLPDRVQYPPLAATDAERRVLAAISEAVKAGELYANVPALDGRMLRLLVESMNAKQVLEIGTSTGISGLWLLLGLQSTGGRLTTLEFDPRRAAVARSHFKKAGVDGAVMLLEGDAHLNIAKVKGPVDLVFIDADKEGYVDYLEKALPLVRPGGLILAHNIEMAPKYVKAVTTNPALETVFYMQGNHLSITLKKR